MDYKQFTFTCANVTKRLPYEDNTFDLVHMRLFIAALREDEWPAAINEVLRVTKPGGMIQLMEYDPKLPKDPTNIFYKTVTAFRNICESRGQNPNIGGELVSLLSKYECLKIIQSEYKAIDMSSGTPMAKRLIWDVIEAFKSMQHVMGPIVGVKSNEIGQFLIDYEHSLQTKESFICFSCVAVQKL
ncbi:hypothetical protein RMATCC62417_18701 [Rhizopus microsporus]|nr:hypothetical protein RMATCC62417_18701 [Rhizopus microsporus]